MEEEKAAAYYDELTRKGSGAARFKQGLGFSDSTSNDAVPSKNSFSLSNFVRASSTSKNEEIDKQAQLQSIQNKLKSKSKVNKFENQLIENVNDNQYGSRSREKHRDSSHRSRSRSHDKYSRSSRDGDLRHRSRSKERRERSRERDLRRRSRRSRSLYKYSRSSRDMDSRRRSRSRSLDKYLMSSRERDSRRGSRSRSREMSRSRERSRSGERDSRRISRSRERRGRSRSRSRKRDLRRRSRDMSRSRERDLRRRSKSGEKSLRRGSRSQGEEGRGRMLSKRNESKSGKNGRDGGMDYNRLIEGYDKMAPAERVKAKMKLQLTETAKKDPTRGTGSGWERFDFDKDATLDDEEEIEVVEDDRALVKNIGQTFRFSAVEARKEDQIKAAHDEAMFGAPTLQLTAEIDEEKEDSSECIKDNSTPDTSLISNQVISMHQVSWRDRVKKM